MMRLRRVSVIVMLSLLISAATAYAECAWVLWEAMDAATNNPTPHVRNWYWVTKGTYPTRHDCYRGMRNTPHVSALKEMKVTAEDLELGSGGRSWGDYEFLWDGNGVNLIGPLSRWWSCQPEGKKPKQGSVLPWD